MHLQWWNLTTTFNMSKCHSNNEDETWIWWIKHVEIIAKSRIHEICEKCEECVIHCIFKPTEKRCLKDDTSISVSLTDTPGFHAVVFQSFFFQSDELKKHPQTVRQRSLTRFQLTLWHVTSLLANLKMRWVKIKRSIF